MNCLNQAYMQISQWSQPTTPFRKQSLTPSPLLLPRTLLRMGIPVVTTPQPTKVIRLKMCIVPRAAKVPATNSGNRSPLPRFKMLRIYHTPTSPLSLNIMIGRTVLPQRTTCRTLRMSNLRDIGSILTSRLQRRGVHLRPPAVDPARRTSQKGINPRRDRKLQ
jgi:hypothetical protein